MSYDRPVNFTSTNRYGCVPDGEDDVYTIDEFIESVHNRSFVDYDGFGHPVKDGMEDRGVCIYPSTASVSIPSDATHIVWYNR